MLAPRTNGQSVSKRFLEIGISSSNRARPRPALMVINPFEAFSRRRISTPLSRNEKYPCRIGEPDADFHLGGSDFTRNFLSISIQDYPRPPSHLGQPAP